MRPLLVIKLALGCAFLVCPVAATALTMSQFTALCKSAPGPCHEHSLVQAYVGGALDLIAVLDEETEHLGEVYCESPAKLFDLPVIIRFMQDNREGQYQKNAMLLVVQYLEDNGNC